MLREEVYFFCIIERNIIHLMWNILIYLLSIYLCLYPWDNPAFNSSFFLGASSLRIKNNLNAFKKIMIKSRFCIYIYKWCSYYVCLIVRRSSINLTLHCSINVYLLFYLPKPTNEDINFNHIVDQKALSKILVGENYFFSLTFIYPLIAFLYASNA